MVSIGVDTNAVAYAAYAIVAIVLAARVATSFPGHQAALGPLALGSLAFFLPIYRKLAAYARVWNILCAYLLSLP
jgi:hypothetical protein